MDHHQTDFSTLQSGLSVMLRSEKEGGGRKEGGEGGGGKEGGGGRRGGKEGGGGRRGGSGRNLADLSLNQDEPS